MVNENGMVECRSAGEDLYPESPRFNGSTPITPQLRASHPSRPLGLGLLEYIMLVFSPAPGKSKVGKCAIARCGATSFCFFTPLEHAKKIASHNVAPCVQITVAFQPQTCQLSCTANLAEPGLRPLLLNTGICTP